MKLVTLALPILLFASTGLLREAHAFGNADAKVVLHLASVTTVGVCARAEAHPACDDIDTSGGLYSTNPYFAYVLVVDGSASEGVAGVEFGIDYDSGAGDGVGVDIFGWTLCATLELHSQGNNWPDPDTANTITWDATTRCQRNEPGGPGTGVVATAGYFYCGAYGSSTLRIVPRVRRLTNPARILVANCASQTDIIDELANPANPSPLGSVAFSASGTDEGTNPCLKVVPVSTTSWSRIKSSLIAE